MHVVKIFDCLKDQVRCVAIFIFVRLTMVRWWSRRWKALPDAPWDSEVWATTRKGPPFPRAGARGKRWSALHPNGLHPLDLLGGALESTNQFNHSKHIQTPGMWSLQVQNSNLKAFFVNVICPVGSFRKVTLIKHLFSIILNECIWSTGSYACMQFL